MLNDLSQGQTVASNCDFYLFMLGQLCLRPGKQKGAQERQTEALGWDTAMECESGNGNTGVKGFNGWVPQEDGEKELGVGRESTKAKYIFFNIRKLATL